VAANGKEKSGERTAYRSNVNKDSPRTACLLTCGSQLWLAADVTHWSGAVAQPTMKAQSESVIRQLAMDGSVQHGFDTRPMKMA
jgi:hypothetical protein